MPVTKLDHLRQQMADGNLLDRDTFQKSMALLLPQAQEDAIAKWADFAQDCVDMGQYVDFVEEPDSTALSRWFDTMLAGFAKLTQQFGGETAAQVCGLGLHNCVLYPYEMERAAEEIQKGSDYDTISELMLAGQLEALEPVFPKLQEVLQDGPQRSGPEMTI